MSDVVTQVMLNSKNEGVVLPRLSDLVYRNGLHWVMYLSRFRGGDGSWLSRERTRSIHVSSFVYAYTEPIH